MKTYNYLAFFILLLFSGTPLVAQVVDTPVDSSNVNAYEQDPWASIELTGSRMKPGLLQPAQASSLKKKVPFWIPLGGGILGGSVVTYLLLQEEEAPPQDTVPGPGPDPGPMPDSLVVRDDAFTLPCLPPFTIQPLLNDEGSGILISAIGVTGTATVVLSGTNALVITDYGDEEMFVFSITVSDSLGNSAVNNISITIERPTISAEDDSFNATFGSPISGNVLANDQGDNLRIIDFTPPVTGGAFELGEDGLLSFIPAADFFGTITIPYTIEDDCGQQASATITIIIAAPDCDFSATLTPSPADCGLANGTITTNMSPADDYVFSWSNGAESQNLEGLLPGDYSVTITSNSGLCVATFTSTIAEATFVYINSVTSAPGDCTGGGEITLDLDAPGSAPLVTTIIGPGGQQQFVLPVGVTMLSDSTNLFPGDYTIAVYPQNAGEGCVLQTAINIADTSVLPMLMNDSYSTPFQTPVSGNILNNDSGMSIAITALQTPGDGTLTYDENGSFTYTPPANFTGTISFTYTITDLCGVSLSGTVSIEVGPPDCDFNVVLQASSADCGLSNGSISTSVSPEGAYTYSWSNGAEAANIEQLPPGDYQLTVTSNGGLCQYTYAATVAEMVGSYISNVSTTPGNCLGGGNITLTLTSPAPGPLTLELTGALGTETFSVGTGTIAVNTLTNLPAGNYSLGVYPEMAGSACSQLVSVAVQDNTPLIVANNDFYTTPFQTAIGGNLLINDQGLEIEVINVTEITGGEVVFTAGGGFTFTPDETFTGMGGFSYLILDSCGETTSASVVITVGAPSCDFSVSLNTQPANCGFDNGAITTLVTPSDEAYTYSWSDGSSNSSLNGITAGFYSLTVTSNSGLCNQSYSVFVSQLPINYFNNTTTTAGTCLGGGNIQLDLNAPDGGLLNGVLNGPSINQTISLPSGVSNLNELFNLRSGSYSITLFSQTAGPSCSQTISLLIPDNTPALSANNDSYTTAWQTPVDGNVITNDSGLVPTMISTEEASGGSVVFAADGTFTFTPSAGFTGMASFIYTIQDACGATAQAEVMILVQAPSCDFEVTLEVTPATCDLNSGSISSSIDPPGMYTYNWSNGATSASISNLPAADYSLTVTSNGGFCTQELSATVMQAAPLFVDSLSTAPGDCAGNGSIIIEVTAPDNGNLVVIINGPSGSSEVTIPSGFSNLGDLVNLPSGVYDLLVYPVSVGFSCNEQTFAEVEDNSPPFVVNDDSYTTPFQTPFINNVLLNDEGLLIEVLEVLEVTGGTVDLSSNGDFLFTPSDGATGAASFVYSAADACNEVQQGIVTIEIGPPNCDFTATFSQTEASCGYNDGSVTATVSPAGDNYTYAWSNGVDTSQVLNLPAGEHTLTITDTTDGCPLSFTFNITESPADYISELLVTPPDCNQDGDVQFLLSGNAPGLYAVTITAPGGGVTELSNITMGLMSISDYMVISSGTYTISAYNQNIGVDCTESIMAVVPDPSLPLINLSGITQPSGGGAMDGSISFSFDQLSTGPYQVNINGMEVGVSSGAPYTAENLGAGMYTIFVTDANGCTSNTITVELVSNLQIRIGWQPSALFFATKEMEPASSNRSPILQPRWRPVLQLVYSHKDHFYQFNLTEAHRYSMEEKLMPVLYTGFYYGQERQNGAGTWRWSTGPAYLADTALGWQWEVQGEWQPALHQTWNLQAKAVWGNAFQWGLGVVWRQ
ncbi:tandem-95 repeat protein [Lewinella sp. LCG006]|uniref:Ig-like domain-containing protein n=1 Tax=Lewinella sp. LCG006 TaxID=3231911 RepID=UPI00345F5914